MICLILAAGYATRMYPLTENFPKPLLKVGDNTIIDWLIDDMESTGKVSKNVVVSNHKFIDKFQKWHSESKLKDKIVILDDGSTENDNRLGAVKDIAFVINELSIEDDLMVLAGDNLLEFSLQKFVDYFYEKQATCVMRYFEEDVARLRKTGVATVDENDKITKMVEKPQEPESNWAIPPFYIYCKDNISKIQKGIDEGCPTDAPGNFIAWLSDNTEVYTYVMPGKRFDIGSIDGYNKIKETYVPVYKKAL